MGSTLAGVINGTALVRGIIALAMLLFWQYFTSYAAMRFPVSVQVQTRLFRGAVLNTSFLLDRARVRVFMRWLSPFS